MLMFIYFSVSLLIYILGYVSIQKNNPIITLFLDSISILMMSYIAGARDSSVGTDTLHYLDNYIYILNKSPYVIIDSYGPLGELEILYKAVLWVSANVFHSSFFLFFIMEMLTLIPLYASFRKISNQYIYIGMSIFALIFFPMSFNVMRQMCAMCFVLLGYTYLMKNKDIPFLICTLIGFGFHSSAIVGLLVIYPLVRIGIITNHNRDIVIFICIICFILGVLFAPRLLPIIMNRLHIYNSYVSGFSIRAGGNRRTFMEIVTVSAILFSLGFTFSYDKNWELIKGQYDDDSNMLPLVLIVILGIISYGLCLYSLWLYRISLYFLIFTVLLIPSVCERIKHTSERYIYITICMSLLIILSLDYYAICHCDGVYPYRLAEMFL